MSSRARVLVFLALLAAVVAAGCGAGAGKTPSEVKLTVTDNFGRERLVETPAPDVKGEETVMRVLQRNAKVATRYGGGFVQSINGRAGGRQGGRPVDWFYYVNGMLADKGATSVKVKPGTRIWWDRHDWSQTQGVPAVVGSFPEPFVHGIGGKRLTTRLECDTAVERSCDVVQKKLNDLGLVVGKTLFGTELDASSIRIIVGRWPLLRHDLSLQQLDRGPKVSGVYARLSPDGRSLNALDADGKVVRRLGAGTGIVAATRYKDDPPTWMVSGTDAAGIRQAADAIDESVLAEKFALAISDGLPVPLPAEAKPAP